jgi:hypothetical protein
VRHTFSSELEQGQLQNVDVTIGCPLDQVRGVGRRQHCRFRLQQLDRQHQALAVAGLASGDNEKPAGAKSRDGFIHADNVDSAMSDVMEDIGVKAISTTIRVPAGHEAIIRIVARDKTGKVLPQIARRHVLHEASEGNNEWTVRLAKIDPTAFNEGYEGKIRWRMYYRSREAGLGPITMSNGEWSRNWFAEDRASTSWAIGKPIENPTPGENYKAWEVDVRQVFTSKQAAPADPEVFHCEMWVKFVKAKPGNPNRSSGRSESTLLWRD